MSKLAFSFSYFCITFNYLGSLVAISAVSVSSTRLQKWRAIWINWMWCVKNLQSWLLRSADRRKHWVLKLHGVLGLDEPKQRLRRNSKYLPQQSMLTLHWNEVIKLLANGFVEWAHFNGHNVLKQSIMITKAALGFVLLQNTHKHTHIRTQRGAHLECQRTPST